MQQKVGIPFTMAIDSCLQIYRLWYASAMAIQRSA
ncbi:hypothetical protein JMJ77_0001977 [Colletotrichum scovillei]|uniref:Uncharacterized protein n=1 Tax=Colletotrichum scovillei TaxID=1209932 RepID=A0A9P7R8S4_9PEZI|nr:hypothetical protein JMJ77_0001977 [Colletotrichum scovillei]KAG7070390.1 hypothetical protein JMJ76_0001643 [Colletotrichum scovillei]KAG7078666.1 hypothetical protein JMJ78_0002335 [Colletotrichum scovillei]